jgi:hypothetical protein
LKGIASKPESEYVIKIENYDEFKTDKLKELVALKACSGKENVGSGIYRVRDKLYDDIIIVNHSKLYLSL